MNGIVNYAGKFYSEAIEGKDIESYSKLIKGGFDVNGRKEQSGAVEDVAAQISVHSRNGYDKPV